MACKTHHELHAILHINQVIYNYLTSSKVKTIDYQIYKYSMVQIWLLKFIKSILDVILIYYLMTIYVHLFPLTRCKL